MKSNYSRKSKEGPNDALQTTKVDHEPLVASVSRRSGRVRKKSSKLIDYESGAEELERPKRKPDNVGSKITPRGSNVKKQSEEYEIDYSANDISLENNSSSNQQASDSEPETKIYSTNDGFEDSSEESSGGEIEKESLVLEDKMNTNEVETAVHPEAPYTYAAIGPGASTSQKSLYMVEKLAKKKKNGRAVKAGRKDKGKARFSAYMLWAREVRPDLMKTHPNIDFSHLSSKLSDLWATVPYTEKYMWKQKAKRMALMAKNSDSREEANLHKAQIKTTLREKYINKKNAPPPRPVGRPSKNAHLAIESGNSPNTITSPEKINVSDITKSASSQPLDVAAHLKLLGESLSIIGQRLKEHEGQIAVSGSLSVLLDTLLCSLGPLICLTQQVEEMNGCSKETITRILDNIAYIMPGL